MLDNHVRQLIKKDSLLVIAWLCVIGIGLIFGKNQIVIILFFSIFTIFLLLFNHYQYLKTVNQTIQEATQQIHTYLNQKEFLQLTSHEEGSLYRLFHELNQLVALLDTHIKEEQKSKLFLKQTISDISHQLKTPIAALTIYNDLIQEEPDNQPLVEEFSKLSEEEIRRIETLVQNLLNLTKFDAQTIVLNKTEINLLDMCNQVRQRFSYRLEKEDKQLIIEGDPGLSFWGDRHWLEEGLINLVENALDHTKAQDQITLSFEKFGSIMQLVVKDTGEGIAPEDVHHIFKRFYRSQFSKTKQGLGLGIPLVKSIVEAHEGTIEVTSELGQGTTFTLNLLIPTKL